MKLGLLKKWAVKLERKNNSVFSYPVTKQKEYLNSLKIPRDNFDRAYNQYCCQMKFNSIVMTFIINIASLPLLIYFFYKKSSFNENEVRFDAVFFSEGIPENVIPESLRSEFHELLVIKKHNEILMKDDKKYFKKLIKRYPISWHFLLKCLIKLRIYSYEIKKHSPKAIIVCGEYSFTSSFLTDYCKDKGVLHINVMHGEKLFFMRDSFFRFDRCYVWDKYYVDLFVKLKTEKSQFKIEIPPSLKLDIISDIVYKYDFTYYLAAENINALIKIADSLRNLNEKGSRIAVRPHPRYSDVELVKKLFDFAIMEDPTIIPIEESLSNTKCAISLYSTVLNQALYNSVPIVIDNISNLENFKKLEELGYICLQREYRLLSDII